MTKLITELQPRYDGRKSFYKKAHVIDYGTHVELRSYSTIVAGIDKEGLAYVNGTYSPTTLRHIKEFLAQRGFESGSKSELEEIYSC